MEKLREYITKRKTSLLELRDKLSEECRYDRNDPSILPIMWALEELENIEKLLID